jgi:hypothetical protein
MVKNKITTVGYFIKRLRDSGYVTDKIFTEYADSDCRSWTVVIDPRNTSVFITCYNNQNFFGEEFFEITDGGQYIPDKFKLKTNSIETLIEYLVKYGINNKSSTYRSNEIPQKEIN